MGFSSRCEIYCRSQVTDGFGQQSQAGQGPSSCPGRLPKAGPGRSGERTVQAQVPLCSCSRQAHGHLAPREDFTPSLEPNPAVLWSQPHPRECAAGRPASLLRVPVLEGLTERAAGDGSPGFSRCGAGDGASMGPGAAGTWVPWNRAGGVSEQDETTHSPAVCLQGHPCRGHLVKKFCP